MKDYSAYAQTGWIITVGLCWLMGVATGWLWAQPRKRPPCS